MYAPLRVLTESITTDFSRALVSADDPLLLLPFSLALLVLTLVSLIPCLLSPETSPDDGDVMSL